MAIIILLFCFVSIFFNLAILNGSKSKDILLKCVLIFSVIFVFITEITSLFHLLNFKLILFSWLGITIFNVWILFLNSKKLFSYIKILKQYCNNTFYEFNKFERFSLFTLFAILIFVFIQGVIYPPNNWDSMTYHMARIPNWISHGNITHYPTHIFRQIYQPPFAEFVILHFNILSGGDYFSNSVQFFFLVFSLFGILSLADLFGLNRRLKLIAIFLVATIPEIVLQASSTQNDIVVSFFILTSIYFAVKSVKEVYIQNYFFLGLSIGLAILTKGVAYIYLAPVLLIFTTVVLVNLYKTKKFTFLGYSVISLIIFLSINSGHYIRNYNLTHNILGLDEKEAKIFSNENMTPKLLVSNIIKNAGLHLGPYPINKFFDKVIYKLNFLVNLDINNQGTNFGNKKYYGSPSFPNHEDSASNPIHFFLILISLILIIKKHINGNKVFDKMFLYLIMITLQVILFCLYLKWQPWNTRLHLPLFLISVPIICYAISLNNKYIKIMYKIFPVIFLYTFLVIIFNSTRPFLSNRFTSNISITDNRYKKYFANRLDLYKEYNAILGNVNKMNYKNIGIVLGGDDWEYPLFTKFYGSKINPFHINVSNITKDIPLNVKSIDCIISTTINVNLINFNGKRFYNFNPKNKDIWLYK